MKEFLAALALIAILAAVGFFAVGWLTFQQTDDQTTIQLKTGEIVRAADEAAGEVVDTTREFVGKVQEEVREEVREHSSDPTPLDAPTDSEDPNYVTAPDGAG